MAKSVVQQRISIDRQRVIGIVLLCAGVTGTAIGVVSLVVGTSGLPISAVAFAAWTLVGIGNLVRSRRRRLDLEREHGVGAGVQKPVT